MKKKIMMYLMTAFLLLSLIPVTAFAKTVTVTNYDDLYVAVDSAKDGDTIIIADRIQIDFGVFLGDDSKHITLKRSGDGCIEIVNSPMDDHWNIFFINLTFDCQGVPSEQFLVNNIVDQTVDINLQGCTFINTGETEEPEPSEPTTEEPTDPEPTTPTEEGGQDGQEAGQEGSDGGQKDSDQGDEEKPTQDTQEGQEGIDTSTQTPEPEQTEPSDNGTQSGQEQKQEEPEQSTDTGTVSGNTNTEETTTSGTTASPDKKDDGTPTTEAKEAPRTQTETPATVTVTIVTDTGTNTINAQDGQNIPVTVPVTTFTDSTGQSGSTTTGQGQTVEGVTVNGQPVTLPDGSGTVTINVVIESPTQEAEQGQVVKSESLTRTSEPTQTQPEQQQEGVDVVQVIQVVLLACILGFLIGDRVNRKKSVEKDSEMK